MENDCRPINVNQYNHEEGKLVASIKWLITRIYQDQGIPDKLSELFYRDEEGNLKLCDAVSSVLTNGSLYSQAASKILRDPGLIVQSHGTILRALSHIAELEVRNYDGSLVTEMALIENPIRLSAHLALIDALMTAHMKSILSIERVVQAVSEYTTVDKREEPMDCVDTLLFWINKICLLVRDDVERSDIPLKNPDATIPEMEDLYEDLCDGTCICALISFYRPHEIILTDVCFNDSISLQDCRYNLGLLKTFCENYLPWNPFHFEIDDILYLHENLQPNINAFLSDLFYFFEPIPEPVYIPSLQSPTQRRFVPINQIPDLRTKNIANRPLYPPKVRPTSMIDNRNRTVSVSSQDSLMTNKSTEKHRPTTLPPGTISTSFGIMMDKYQSPNDYDGEKMQENKESTNLAAIRLAMHQRRQEYEQKQFLENSVTEVERQKAGKDAFFKLIKGSDSQNRTRAQSEMTTKTMLPTTNALNGSDNSSGSNHQQPPPTSREEMLSAQVQSLQEQIQTMALLNRSTPGISHAISQPSIYNDGLFGGPSPMYNQQLPPDMYKAMAPYGYPPQQQPQLFEQSNYALPHQITPQIPQNSYYPPMRYGTPQHHHVPNPGMSYSMYEQSLLQQQQQPSISPNLYGLPQQQQSFDDYGQQTIPNANNTFYLHQANASNSRLDPSLELNRNLTNWGLTYRSTTKTPRKTWADFKSEHDLRNSNENDDENVQFHSSKHEFQQRSSPPKDPEDVKPTKQQLENSLMKKSPTSPLTNGSTGFEIKNVGNNVVEDVTPEMRAKRDALYANLMKRKEQIADKVEEIEAKNMEKRQKEIEKQELAEQRRIEKEIRRQKLLDEYKRKKLEKEFPDLSTSSPNMSARSTTSLQRGHSQPPFVSMAKSQSNMTEVLTRSTPRPSRAKSNVGDENSTPRVVVPSTAEPTLKLYAKHVPKSNRSLILNALQYSIFPGAVSNEQRDKVKDALAHSDSKHFLLLFRDHKCQYRGLYTWDEQSDTAHRIHGMGPKIVKDEMMCMMYKYDSGSKHFNPIPAKHLSPTIDGFLIQEQLWMKPKIPHSGGR